MILIILLLLAGGIIYATFASNPMSFDDLIELRFLSSRRRHRDPERPDRTHAHRLSIALCQQQLSAWRVVIGQFFSDQRRMRGRLTDPRLSGMPLDGPGQDADHQGGDSIIVTGRASAAELCCGGDRARTRSPEFSPLDFAAQAARRSQLRAVSGRLSTAFSRQPVGLHGSVFSPSEGHSSSVLRFFRSAVDSRHSSCNRAGQPWTRWPSVSTWTGGLYLSAICFGQLLHLGIAEIHT